MSKITPCLWFDSNAEEAVAFYTSVFPNSRVLSTALYGESDHEHHRDRAGSVMVITFELNDQTYTALNGGPLFKFNEAISLQVFCDTQKEIDSYWEKLCEGGDERAQQCGWLKDKFGLSWQVVPAAISIWMGKDRATSDRVMNAILKMKKIDIAAIERAFANPS